MSFPHPARHDPPCIDLPRLTKHRLWLVILPSLLTLLVLAAHADPAAAQSSPNGSVPVETGKLSVLSDIQPDANALAWRLEVTGSTAFTEVLTGDAGVSERTVVAGSYALTLTSARQGDYNSAYRCRVDGKDGPSGAGTSVTVNVPKNKHAICTFTHVRKTGPITFVQQVRGGDATADAWRFGVAGTPFTAVRPGDEIRVPTGTYTVNQTGPAAYRRIQATGVCRLDGGALLLNVTEAGGVCTVTSQQAELTLVEPYGVVHLREGAITGPGSEVCYRVVASVPPVGNVKVRVTHDEQVRVQPGTVVMLNAANWNLTSGSDVSNRVCVRAVDDAVDERAAERCKNRTNNANGGGDSGTSVCANSVASLGHAVDTSDDLAFTAATPFLSNGVTDLDANPATVDVLIVDNDIAGINIQQTDGVSALREGQGETGLYAVALRTQPRAAVTVQLTWDPAQLEVSPDRLTFTPGNWATAQRISVRARDDEEDEPNAEVCYATQSGATVCGDHTSVIEHTVVSDDAKYAAAQFAGNGPTAADAPQQVLILLRDNDTAGLDASPSRINLMEGNADSFSVRLRSRPTANVRVTIDDPALGSTLFRPDNRTGVTLFFTPTNWNVPQTVALQERDNDVADGTRQRAPRITMSSADPQYDDHNVDTALQLIITDDDSAGVIVHAPDMRITEGGAGVMYSLRLTSRPTASVTISVTTGGLTVAEPPAVTFVPERWDEPAQIVITARDDRRDLGDTVAEEIRHRATSADPQYAGSAVEALPVTIQDDDTAALVVTPPASTTLTEGAEVPYAVALQTEPAAPVRVRINVGELLAAVPASLTFTPENWATAQPVQIIAADDYIDTLPDRTPMIVSHLLESDDPRYQALAPSGFTLEVVDNDQASLLFSQASIQASQTKPGEYRIVLASEPVSGVLVQLAPSADLSLNVENACNSEASATSCLFFTPATWNQPQRITVTMSGTRPQTIRHVVVSSDPAYEGDEAVIMVYSQSQDGFRQYLPAIAVRK